ncbi:MAG TPA: hypothetical protein VGD29_08260 [Actinoplanes sp.]|jgi:hypothetical protein
MHTVPLSSPAAGEILEWTASAPQKRGVPEHLPGPMPLPSTQTVLAAFRAAGCHGSAWFEVTDAETVPLLAECPDPGVCSRTGGLDLGEVSLTAIGYGSPDQPLSTDAAIEGTSFRKPATKAVLAAMCALAPSAGPQLVFDDSAGTVFVVRPGERVEDLAAEWPW